MPSSNKSLKKGSGMSVAPASKSHSNACDLSAFQAIDVSVLDPQQRIELVRHGLPAARITQLSQCMGVSKNELINALQLSRATISRKERSGGLLSSSDTERILGLEGLIFVTLTMLRASGTLAGFDAPRWLGGWLTSPLPALGGATPAMYMDTFEGQRLVHQLLSMSQSGAYA